MPVWLTRGHLSGGSRWTIDSPQVPENCTPSPQVFKGQRLAVGQPKQTFWFPCFHVFLVWLPTSVRAQGVRQLPPGDTILQPSRHMDCRNPAPLHRRIARVDLRAGLTAQGAPFTPAPRPPPAAANTSTSSPAARPCTAPRCRPPAPRHPAHAPAAARWHPAATSRTR